MNSVQRKKVLFIITRADTGGAQKYVHDIITRLNPHEFESIALYGERDLSWLKRNANPWLFFLPDWLALRELYQTLHRLKPAIVHLNSSKDGVLGSLAAFLYNQTAAEKIKVVFTAHGWVFNPTDAWPAIIRYAFVLFHKIAAYFQDAIICVSEYDRKLALRYHIAPPKKLTTIYNGIDPLIEFFSKEDARSMILNKITKTANGLTLPSRPKPKSKWPWIGSIGRLVREKNYETLVRAAQYVPQANFILIGEGPELKKLQKLSERLKVNLFFIPPTGKDYQYLKALDVFVMSSIKEGLPYIALEAMAASLPIVVTETGGMPEIIQHHEDGIMVAQRNPEALAQAILGLLHNARVKKDLQFKGKNIVKQKFSVQAMIAQTENVYRQITGAKF